MKKSPVTLLIGLCVAVLSAPAAWAEPGELARLQAAIQQRADSGQFMGSVLVARNGQVLLHRAYGMASLAPKIPNQTETRFRVGSVTKELTAAGILLLQERGQLKLDDRVVKYMPEVPDAWSEITIRQLLAHTSGLPNLTSLPDYRATEGLAATPRQLLARVHERDLEFRPGTSFNYSNTGYILLGALIETLSGEPYGRFVQKNFLRPLHMWSSGYAPNAGRMRGQAQGYQRDGGGLVAAPYIDMSVPFSSAGLYSTSGDLLKWVRGLYGGKVLHPESLKEMLTPGRNHYGLGVEIEAGPAGDDVYSTRGGIDGFNTRVAYSSRSKLTVIVLSNVSGNVADDLVTDLRKVADGQPGAAERPVSLVGQGDRAPDRAQMNPAPAIPSPSDRNPAGQTQADRTPADRSTTPTSRTTDRPVLDRGDLERLSGHYWTEDATLLSVTRRADHLLVQGAGGSRELYPDSRRDFSARASNVQLSFAEDAQGKVEALVLHLGDRAVHADKINEAAAQAIFDMRARKLRERTPSPGSEDALRGLIAGISAGDPDYSRLGPTVDDQTRRELPKLQALFEKLGALRHIDFIGVAPRTAEDRYLVTFENGPVQMRIAIGPDGRIWSRDVRNWHGVRPQPGDADTDDADPRVLTAEQRGDLDSDSPQ